MRVFDPSRATIRRIHESPKPEPVKKDQVPSDVFMLAMAVEKHTAAMVDAIVEKVVDSDVPKETERCSWKFVVHRDSEGRISTMDAIPSMSKHQT